MIDVPEDFLLGLSLPEDVRQYAWGVAQEWHRALFGLLLPLCESPIEQLLYTALVGCTTTERVMANLPEGARHTIDFMVWPQRTVETKAGRFRCDLLVELFCDGKRSKILVECDGHEFHEKTKEQVARDRARDRAIQAAGYHLLRFTGSEIFASPKACAQEVVALLMKQAGFEGE